MAESNNTGVIKRRHTVQIYTLVERGATFAATARNSCSNTIDPQQRERHHEEQQKKIITNHGTQQSAIFTISKEKSHTRSTAKTQAGILQ